ncbi:hypothetical protein WOLCODRAFT_91821 [Wolfiporia cocos MD-104 SS10]|uniref:Zinc finger C2H2 LYAR-type domain-containing protein n=1 Tax=Wolfiporia cocos (strain MD-104) TaxID=742152 RepID=A0A2H3JEE9_WOLCO|nr:hypothetical protein WOLCODRAFT_91821 [Wolfiporia cocos MD-104 SS10]
MHASFVAPVLIEVAYRCEGCGDTVKKPKLDVHRSQCNSSFTCIDCMTTFSGPAQYKAHTQCISEAEKYQKGLYKGQQNGGPRNNNRGNGDGRQNGSTGKYQPWARNSGPGGSSRRGHPRNEASGANNTPLGTPARMSPVTSPVISSPPEQDKMEEPVPAASTLTSPPPKEAKEAEKKEEKKGKKEKKKEKKEKVQADEKGAESTVAEPTKAEETVKSKKKGKEVEVSEAAASEAATESSTKNDADAVAAAESTGEKQKRKRDEAVAEDAVKSAPAQPAEAGAEKSKKNKKRRKSELADGEDETAVKDVEATTADEGKKKKKNKSIKSDVAA